MEAIKMASDQLVMKAFVDTATLEDGTEVEVSKIVGAAIVVQFGGDLDRRYSVSYEAIVNAAYKQMKEDEENGRL